VVITLWGTRRIAQRLEELGAAPFRAINSVVGPLVATAATAMAFGLTAYVRNGSASGLLRGLTWLLLGIAFWSFLWTYGSLQVGLSRLGHRLISRDAALVDPALGLLPVGAVAFLGLWLLLAWLVPVLLTGLPDVVGFAISVFLLAAGLGSFVFSL
jgi:hypothetical protein